MRYGISVSGARTRHLSATDSLAVQTPLISLYRHKSFAADVETFTLNFLRFGFLRIRIDNFPNFGLRDLCLVSLTVSDVQ